MMDLRDFSNLVWLLVAALFVMFLCAACGSIVSPNAPASTTTTASAPPALAITPLDPCAILLAGQSNAVLFRDVIPCAPNVVQGGTGIAAWEQSQPLGAELISKASCNCMVFVWWQGEHDGDMTTDAYAASLRAIIANVRVAHPSLAVRIVEMVNIPSLATVRAAHRLVAQEAGNALIQTSDLVYDDVHLTTAGFPIVLDRITRSLP